MIIYVDIDETICTTPESRDYTLATPIIENVQKINDLYDEGHEIVYWTARGTLTGYDWTETTKKQFEDRAINSNIYFEDNNDKGDFKRQ